jgi:hypothetical protein
MKLFGDLVEWQANKQMTVTISITEAELLALLQAACEGIYINWLLKNLEIGLNNKNVIIQYDNQQMFCLIT